MHCSEQEMLEIRLRSLTGLVDYWVNFEGEETFQGNSKPLYLKHSLEQKDPLLREYAHQIIYVPLRRSQHRVSTWVI